MRVRRHRMLPLLASLSSCFLLGGGCKDTVREALFTGALEFVQGQVAGGLLDELPVDEIIGTVLNPFAPTS